ncbi:snRNA-activating protein complex subunit 5 [Spea bombifrons]|uniref:snRNA-activating protein complex subunit 5 n=1 Tax=Spea bombifrons TaxID=233779 RepID=UPI00234B8091|nr:snRNA-activating protein complex subunit 5 [Spea bombifrons]
MLSRLQELKKEEETLLKIKASLHDQLNRLKVEELALQSMINCGAEEDQKSSSEAAEEGEMHMDNEAVINQTELQLSTMDYTQDQEEMEEEEEESDS